MREEEITRTTMLRQMLVCCKLYISESRNAPALRAVEQAARLHLHPAGDASAVLVNRFTDDAYNRVGYTLVSPLAAENATSPTPLQPAVSGMVSAAFEASLRLAPAPRRRRPRLLPPSGPGLPRPGRRARQSGSRRHRRQASSARVSVWDSSQGGEDAGLH